MRFFFDENLGPQLSNGLKEFGEDTCHLRDHFAAGTPDETWLEFIGQRGWFLLTLDKRIRRRPLEKAALKKHRVGAFFLLGKNMGRWDYICQVVRAWHKIKEAAANERPPFAYQVDKRGASITRLSLD
ncbi:MAG: DUF5615 family PIN-like protein [Chloroflexota bacterium]